MEQAYRRRLVIAVLVILLGVYLFAVQFFPELRLFAPGTFTLPLILAGIGVAFAVAALLAGIPGLIVPAAILVGLGAIFYWQSATNNFSSWSYAWALIPGFVGVGVLLMHAMLGKLDQGIRAGGTLIIISLILFFVFGSLFGGLALLGDYWPLLLIALGLILLGSALFRRAKS